MSYCIEYAKKVFYEVNSKDEKIYFLFIRQGDNNVWDRDDKARAKDWNFVASGTIGELWKEIGGRSGSTEGGGLQKSTGWTSTERYTIEEYIKGYRSKVKNARPLSEFLNEFTISATIALRDCFEIESCKQYESVLRDFISRYGMQKYGTDYYNKDQFQYEGTIVDSEMLKDFLLNLPQKWNKDFRISFHIEKLSGQRRRLYA
jgi:hypothetical protein